MNPPNIKKKGAKTVFVITLGFSPELSLSTLIEEGMKSGDECIYIVPSEKNPRSTLAQNQVETQLSQLRMVGIMLEWEFLGVSSQDLVSAAKKILCKLWEHKGDHLIIDISGGMRILGLATYIAASYLPKSPKVFLRSESTKEKIPLPLHGLPLQLEENQLRLLQVIQKMPDTRRVELAKELNKDPSTISRTIPTLEKYRLVETIQGRTRLSLQAELLLTTVMKEELNC